MIAKADSSALPDRQGPVAAPQTSTGAHVLVVDDDPPILRAVRSNLAAHGYSVQVAQTGAEAMAIFQHQHPDLIVLDLGLPDMDGLDIIRSIRQQSQVPIVVLS